MSRTRPLAAPPANLPAVPRRAGEPCALRLFVHPYAAASVGKLLRNSFLGEANTQRCAGDHVREVIQRANHGFTKLRTDPAPSGGRPRPFRRKRTVHSK